MVKLVLLRHGQSTWNMENRFTGWTDVDLARPGVDEAHYAAHALGEEGYTFDCAYTSVLKRAIRTLWIVQDDLDLMWLPVIKDWRLNERHYGALQGLNKAETAQRYGEDQVHQWRRGFAVRPPALEPDDERIPHRDRRYAHLERSLVPYTESLADTMVRTLQCWEECIVPRLRRGERLIIVAHGNSLRALVKHLDGISDEEITKLNIPTGIPLVYELDEQLAVRGHRYLADEATVEAAQSAVAHQAHA